MRAVLLALALCPGAPAQGAEWQARERVETYPVSGATGIALYREIGEKGPKAGLGRAIAYTDFELTWRRDYRPRGDGGCVLAGAVPNLVITYRWPEARGPMPAATQKLWDTFIEGVKAHERVHGDIIVDMVNKIVAVSVGLSADDDPGCDKVRAKLQEHVGALFREQQRRSRAFDRAEMSEGGNVHRLVLGLVND